MEAPRLLGRVRHSSQSTRWPTCMSLSPNASQIAVGGRYASTVYNIQLPKRLESKSGKTKSHPSDDVRMAKPSPLEPVFTNPKHLRIGRGSKKSRDNAITTIAWYPRSGGLGSFTTDPPPKQMLSPRLLAAAKSSGNLHAIPKPKPLNTSLIATGSENSAVVLFRSFIACAHLEGHSKIINKLAWEPFGNSPRLASASRDGLVNIWDVHQLESMIKINTAQYEKEYQEYKNYITSNKQQTRMNKQHKLALNTHHSSKLREEGLRGDNLRRLQSKADTSSSTATTQAKPTKPKRKVPHIEPTFHFSQSSGPDPTSGSSLNPSNLVTDHSGRTSNLVNVNKLMLSSFQNDFTSSPSFTQNCPVRDLSFHPKKKDTLAVGLNDGTLCLFDLRTKGIASKIHTVHGVLNVCEFHPLWGNAIATGGRDGYVKVWDIRNSDQPLYLWRSPGNVNLLSWRPGYLNQIITASHSNDTRVYLWDISRPYHPVYSFSGIKHPTTAISLLWHGPSGFRKQTNYSHPFDSHSCLLNDVTMFQSTRDNFIYATRIPGTMSSIDSCIRDQVDLNAQTPGFTAHRSRATSNAKKIDEATTLPPLKRRFHDEGYYGPWGFTPFAFSPSGNQLTTIPFQVTDEKINGSKYKLVPEYLSDSVVALDFYSCKKLVSHRSTFISKNKRLASNTNSSGTAPNSPRSVTSSPPLPSMSLLLQSNSNIGGFSSSSLVHSASSKSNSSGSPIKHSKSSDSLPTEVAHPAPASNSAADSAVNSQFIPLSISTQDQDPVDEKSLYCSTLSSTPGHLLRDQFAPENQFSRYIHPFNHSSNVSQAPVSPNSNKKKKNSFFQNKKTYNLKATEKTLYYCIPKNLDCIISLVRPRLFNQPKTPSMHLYPIPLHRYLKTSNVNLKSDLYSIFQNLDVFSAHDESQIIHDSILAFIRGDIETPFQKASSNSVAHLHWISSLWDRLNGCGNFIAALQLVHKVFFHFDQILVSQSKFIRVCGSCGSKVDKLWCHKCTGNHSSSLANVSNLHHKLKPPQSQPFPNTRLPLMSEMAHKSTKPSVSSASIDRCLPSKPKGLLTCIVCQLPVRGLYTWCRGCGHGGHAQHVHSWFSSHSCCPTGCGHVCRLVSSRSTLVATTELN